MFRRPACRAIPITRSSHLVGRSPISNQDTDHARHTSAARIKPLARRVEPPRRLSKLEGKKVRILIHLDPERKRTRLFFHPSPPYHSELRLEISDAKQLTLAGRQRLVYGFCHELGHMIAMWGEYPGVEDDKHA